ncbi:TorF family putative porin [Novosphingobium sp. JCM 18896]|uniref:TorF family putative porin n=1 Tax=Novosphingobium sp. JCM 18896 TaxID=2989731 RepID=UPI002222D5D4|nr:TorF family putative porin [Novosphingobium sp. JCM 18896]MCW1430401.1 TorF family putative porin [Novosphingobium sp. JCM 18896]
MKKIIAAALATATLVVANPAFAQDAEAESAIKVTGSVTLASDYRFRGVSQTDKAMAIQGGITVTHESGLYVGTWASNLSGWGTFGGSNTELDLIGGYAMDLGGATLDVGLTWYMYPGGADKTDFAEPYVKLSTTQGPVSLLAGVAYAPKQEALGRWYASGAAYGTGVPTTAGAKDDNLYIWGDAAYAIPETPFKLKAHIGYSDGNPGLGPNGTSVAPTGKYLDWSLGGEAAWGPLTLGVSWIDTDISNAESAYLQPNFSSTKDGSSIAGSTVLVSLTAAF